MKYEQFDAMIGGSTKESVLLLLKKCPQTLDSIAKALKIDKTSAHYQLNSLGEKVTKKRDGRLMYYGLKKEFRLMPEKANGAKNG